MNTPSVSVVMSVYNGERWLAETLASLRMQTFTDFEIVAIDDGSSDGSKAILEAAAASDHRYRIISQENRGLVAALNLGLKEARAPLVARIDADDIAEPERLERQVGFMNAHPEVVALGSAIRVIDASGRFLRTQSYPLGPSAVAKSMQLGSALAHPAVMMRREAVLGVGGYREAFRHAEDYDLWLRLGDRHDLDNLSQPLLRYREHGGSVSFKYRQQQVLATFVARYCSKIRRAGGEEPLVANGRQIGPDSLTRLGLSCEEEAAFYFDSIKAALWPLGQSNDEIWLQDFMDKIWGLRGHLPRGRLVRRCIMPYVLHCRLQGHRDLSKLWVARAFKIAPLSTCWWFLRQLRGKQTARRASITTSGHL
jgi:glycosyltransferase involved in cell wall biosynthesis